MTTTKAFTLKVSSALLLCMSQIVMAASPSDQQMWDVLCTTKELGGTSSQAMNDSRTTDPQGVIHYDRLWSAGLNGRGCHIVLRVFKTPADAKKHVEDYGASAKATRVNIGDGGFTTQDVAPKRPFYRIYRGRYALSMSMYYFRSSIVEDLKPYLRLMVNRIDKLPKGPIQAISITAASEVSFTLLPQANPKTLGPGATVPCKAAAKCNLGHSVSYMWTCSGGGFANPAVQNPIWTAPSGPVTGGMQRYTLTCKATCSGGAGKSASVVQAIGDPLVLSVKADTNKVYITSDTITIGGKVAYAGQAVDGADIQVKITNQAGKGIPCAGAVSKRDGTFSFSVKINPIDLTRIDKVGDWTVTIKAVSPDPQQGAADEKIKIKVAPVRLNLESFKLVQVVELPEKGGGMGQGKEAGARVVVSCPSLKGLITRKPKVKIALDVGSGPQSASVKGYPVIKEIEVGPDKVALDFLKSDMTFVNTEGTYGISVKVDSDETYTDPPRVNGLMNHKGVTVKKMKSMSVCFAPCFIDLTSSPTAMNDYMKTCRAWATFMKEVYPLPRRNFTFLTTTKSCSPLLPPQGDLARIALLKELSIRSYLVADKVIGVVPNNSNTMPPGAAGVMGWNVLWWHTRAALVKQGANVGDVAHEIAHLSGLNLWGKEEYHIVAGPGRELTKELFMKGGKIYDASNKQDIKNAFGRGCRFLLCFMGRSRIATQGMQQWVCPVTRNELFQALKDPPGRTVLISGRIDPGHRVTLDNWFVRYGEPDLPGKGDYTVACLDPMGGVLASAGFGKAGNETNYFSFVIPYPNKTERMVIKHRNRILRTVRPSPGIPQVTVLSPNGGERAGDQLTIAWQATDADNDTLNASILFSDDNGSSWTALAVELSGNQYTANIKDIAGSNQCLVKVVVNDGFNTSSDISDAVFDVANRPPIVSIERPATHTVQIEQGATLDLKAAAWDLETEQLLSTDAITWQSSLQGALGTGGELKLNNLVEGRHNISASIEDPDRMRGQADLTVTVVRAVQKIFLNQQKTFVLSTDSHEIFIGQNIDPATADIRLRCSRGSVDILSQGNWFSTGKPGMITPAYGKRFKIENVVRLGSKIEWTFSHSLNSSATYGLFQKQVGSPIWRKTHDLILK